MGQSNSFVKAVYGLFNRKGYAKARDMADLMGKKSPNFIASLHALSKSRNFKSGFGLALLRTLEVSEDTLNNLLTKQDSVNDSFISLLDDHNKTFVGLKAKFSKELIRIISGLEAGDRCIFVTSQTPPEFDNPELKTVYMKAISKGVQFVYCFPKTTNTGFCSYLDNNGINYSIYKYLSYRLSDFQASLKEHARYLNEKKSADFTASIDTIDELIKNQVTMVNSDSYLLMHPLHAYRIIETKQNNQPLQFVLEENISGEAFGTIEDASTDFWHQLPYKPARKIIDETYKVFIQ